MPPSAASAPPKPPAAPPPRTLDTSASKSSWNICSIRSSRRVSIFTSAGLAPFCGPNTSAAAVKVVVTSHATSSSTCLRRAIAVIALMAPNPPSVVADPPKPTMMRRAPASSAWSISSPVPAVVASSGSLPADPPAMLRPLALAISMTAVSFAKRHPASTGSPSGPVTTVVLLAPPSASSSPSPPSAIGTSSHSIPNSQQAWPIALAASCAETVPRNLSGAATTRLMPTLGTLLAESVRNCRPCR